MMIRATIFRKRTIAVLAVLWGLPASFSNAGDHFGAHSAAHRCSGCATGQCQVSPNFGYYAPIYRRWPGSTIYEGYRSQTTGATVPGQKIPSVLDEGRVEPRTRSDRPLGPQRPLPGPLVPGDAGGSAMPGNTMPGSTMPGSTVPGSNGSASPLNGFAPESELRSGGTNSSPAGSVFETPPAVQPESSNAGDLFNLPTDDSAPAAPANDAPFDPFGPATDDTPLFDPAGAGEPDFGAIQPPTRKVNVRAVRAIRNRAAVLYPADESLPSASDRAVKAPAEANKSEMDDAFDFSGLLPLSQDSPKRSPAAKESAAADKLTKTGPTLDANAAAFSDWVGRSVNPVSFDQPIQNNVITPSIASAATHAEPDQLPEMDTEPLPMATESQSESGPMTASKPNDQPAAGAEATEDADVDEYITLPSNNPLRKGKRVLKSSLESSKTAARQQSDEATGSKVATNDVADSKSQVETVSWEAEVAQREETMQTKPLATTTVHATSTQTRSTGDFENVTAIELHTSGAVSPNPRSLAQSGRHSLRESLRKNPLR